MFSTKAVEKAGGGYSAVVAAAAFLRDLRRK